MDMELITGESVGLDLDCFWASFPWAGVQSVKAESPIAYKYKSQKFQLQIRRLSLKLLSITFLFFLNMKFL